MNNTLLKSSKIQTDRGLIKMIAIIVIALIVLGYFGFNIREIINSPTVHDNLTYTQSLMLYVWDNFLKTPVMFFWNLFINLIWEPGIAALERMRDGGHAVAPEQVPNYLNVLRH